MAEIRWDPGPYGLCAAPTSYEVQDEAGRVLCECWHMDQAHLFRASPELYGALEELVGKLQHLGSLNLPSIRRAEAALAKARGEAPSP